MTGNNQKNKLPRLNRAPKKESKTGGGDLALQSETKVNRQQLFENVLTTMKNNKCDSAMELLVELHHHCSEEHKKLLEEVCTYDTIASLAIVLQPYSSSGNKYISDEHLLNFVKAVYNCGNEAQFISSDTFTLSVHVADEYSKIVEKCKKDTSKLEGDDMQSIIEKAKEHMCSLRKTSSVERLYAEAELRALSAIVLDNSNADEYVGDMMALCNKCNLDKPYYCAAKENDLTLPFYYSVVNILMNSDSLFKNKETNMGSLENLIKKQEGYNMNKTFEFSRAESRKKSQDKNRELSGIRWR
jgi:hypothetical protein